MVREIGKFTLAPTHRADVDAAGSTVDSIYADAIIANMPTTVVKEKGLLLTKDVTGQADAVTFPVFDNFNLTWTDISGTGSDMGSEVSTTTGVTGKFKKITPVQSTAALFITDNVDLLTNKADFELYSRLGGTAVSRKLDQDAISDGIMDAETASGSNVYACGGFSAEGSINAGSTLTPSDISEGKRLLGTGSNVYHPDAVLMHPNQYNQLSMHQDLSVNANTAASKKAQYDAQGNLIGYDGMEIVVTELVDSGSSDPFDVSGHPVAIMTKGLSGALATKNSGFRVTTQDDRLRHGKYKIFDIMFKADILVPESIVILRAAD